MYYGCNKEITDKRDYKSYICGAKQTELPDQYEITMPNVKDQGIVNSCVAHCLATFMEETYKDQSMEFSTGFIYGYRPQNYSQSEGMYPRQALKTLLNVGDVPKQDFDHNKEMPEIKEIVDKNISKLSLIAQNYRIDSYSRIYTEQEIKKCIYNDIAVPISIPVYNDLDYNPISFKVKMPIGNVEGYHAVIIYGYNEDGWLIQNSWGKGWANQGRAILPYDYPIDTAWAIDTAGNNLVTYQTVWQKLYALILRIIDFFKK